MDSRTLALPLEVQHSIHILAVLDTAYFYKLEKEEVIIYSERMKPTDIKFSANEVISAVMYYYENRELESVVSAAMGKEGAKVPIYSPHRGKEERWVVVELHNYSVPQILEFGFLILHQLHYEK